MPTPLGPGTITIGDAPGDSFAAEVTGASISHSYDTVERKATLADTAKPPPRPIPGADTVKLDMLADLGESGSYAFAFAHDLEVLPFQYVPHAATGAKWAGTVRVMKPSEIGASEWGADLESSVELTCPTPLTFTPATTAPAAADLDA
jgi:hypothetical protein